MTRKEFTDAITSLVARYLSDSDTYGPNPQIRVNPSSRNVAIVRGTDMLAEIEDSNEAVEDAAGAHGMADQDATDFQVSQNPDFYSVSTLFKVGQDGFGHPDREAIAKIADSYDFD